MNAKTAILAAIAAAIPLASPAAVFRHGPNGIVQSCTGGSCSAAAKAAIWTVQNNPLCYHSLLGDFYWEIGNSSGVLVNGQVGSSVNRYSYIQLDSASKWIYGTYYVQSIGGVSNLSASDVNFLHQTSGYTNEPSKCPASQSVLLCMVASPGTGCSPASGYTVDGQTVTSTEYGALCGLSQGLFHYSGGNFQAHAVFNGSSTFYNAGRGTLSDLINAEVDTPTVSGVTSTSGNANFANTGTNGLANGEHVYMVGTVPGGFAIHTPYYVTGTPTATSFQLSATSNASTNTGALNGVNTATPITPSTSVSVTTMYVAPVLYGMPLLAGGANDSVAGYASILQNILNANLSMNGALGAYTVCTNYLGNTNAQGTGEPSGGVAGRYYAYSTYAAQTLNGVTFGSPTTPTTVTSSTTVGSGPNGGWIVNGVCQTNATSYGSAPIPENWLYAMAHWLEHDPASNGDGAFSSAGSKGFYPWIDASKTYYGILARVGATGGIGFQSAQCGRLIRRAFITGTNQSGTIPTP